jgi:hypothetical protein
MKNSGVLTVPICKQSIQLIEDHSTNLDDLATKLRLDESSGTIKITGQSSPDRKGNLSFSTKMEEDEKRLRNMCKRHRQAIFEQGDDRTRKG